MKYIKYPRTRHLPWSEGATSDDKRMPDTDMFSGKRVVVTEKMDGENTTWYHNHIHARSINSKGHPSRNYVKGMWARRKHLLSGGIRVCGENVFAKHSIGYEKLPSYFLGFSVWDKFNTCMSWRMTTDWFEYLAIQPVPLLYEGMYDEIKIRDIGEKAMSRPNCEGYVVRIWDMFHFDWFPHYVGKCVRKDHVQTDQHWLKKEVVPNKLLGNSRGW